MWLVAAFSMMEVWQLLTLRHAHLENAAILCKKNGIRAKKTDILLPVHKKNISQYEINFAKIIFFSQLFMLLTPLFEDP